MSNTTKIKVSELVEDFDFYPRMSVDSQHVTMLAEAIEAGAEMPAIIVDVASKRIVDGFHRARACRRVYGKEGEIAAVLKRYVNDAAMLLEAMKLNATHGRSLTSYDKTHAIALAMKFEIDPEIVAGVLNMKVERVEGFKVERMARIENTRRVVPIKRVVQHFAGREITQEQAATIPSLGGNSAGFYAHQLVLLIDNDMLDTEDEKLVEQLEELGGKLVAYLRQVKKAA